MPLLLTIYGRRSCWNKGVEITGVKIREGVWTSGTFLSFNIGRSSLKESLHIYRRVFSPTEHILRSATWMGPSADYCNCSSCNTGLRLQGDCKKEKREVPRKSSSKDPAARILATWCKTEDATAGYFIRHKAHWSARVGNSSPPFVTASCRWDQDLAPH